MKKILSNKQIFDVMFALKELANVKFPAKLAWKLNTVNKTLLPFYTTANEVMDEIRQRYAKRKADGSFEPSYDATGTAIPNTIVIAPEDVPLVNEQLSDVLAQTVTIENITVQLSDFPDGFEISPAVISLLDPIIEG